MQRARYRSVAERRDCNGGLTLRRRRGWPRRGARREPGLSNLLPMSAAVRSCTSLPCTKPPPPLQPPPHVSRRPVLCLHRRRRRGGLRCAPNPREPHPREARRGPVALTASSPRTPPSLCPHRAELPPSPSLTTGGSATTGTGLPPTTTSTPASRSRGVDLAASASGASGGDASDTPPRPASPLGANLFSYTSFVDTLICPTASLASPVVYTGTIAAAVSAPSSPMGYVSPSLLRGRNSPRSMSDDILAEGEGGDQAMESGGSRSSTAAIGRGQLGFHVSRDGRHTHRRAGPRSKLMPQQVCHTAHKVFV